MLRGWDTDGLRSEWQRATPLTRGAPEFRRVEVRVRRHGLHRRDARRSRVPRGGRSHRAGRRWPQTSRRGIRGRSSTSTRRTSTPSATSAAGSPMSGWRVWSGWMPRPGRSTRALARGTGVVVTADHGMVDVPRHRHVLLAAGDGLVDGVRHIGGEPRMLHLYAETGRRGRRCWRRGARRSPRARGCSRAPRRSTRDSSGGRGGGAPADRRCGRRASRRHRVLRRQAGRQGRPEDDRPARLADGRRARRAAHPPGRVRLTGAGRSLLGARPEHDLVPRRHRRAALAAAGLGDRGLLVRRLRLVVAGVSS